MSNESPTQATNAIGSNALFGTPLKDVTNAEQLRKIAESLWQLLDDIDTASDMFKPQDEASFKTFYKYAMRKCAERGKELESDGYTLFLPNVKRHPERAEQAIG